MMTKSYANNFNGGRKARVLGNLNFDKFMKLARNSFAVKKYSRAVDNCRLAVEFAVRQSDPESAAAAYRLWIKSLFELSKFAEIKKVCCDARSKFGHSLDLLYYEFKAAVSAGYYETAAKLAREFIVSHKSLDPKTPPAFNMTADKIGEVTSMLEKIGADDQSNQVKSNLEQANG